MTRIDLPGPTLAQVLRFAAELIKATEADIVAGRGEAGEEGRDLFVWLARHVTDASLEAIAFAVNASPADAERRSGELDRRRARERRFREVTDEAALELHVEAALVKRKLVTGAPDRDAAVIARRVLSGDRQVLSLPVNDLVRLAASYEALLRRIEDLRRANEVLLSAAYTPNERGARQKRDDAVRALFSITTDTPSRERFHG